MDLSRHSTLERPQSSGSQVRPSSRLSQRSDPRRVLCDFCSGRKSRAAKSCLTCLASYCETHLQSHYEFPAFMKHKLVTATGQLREEICAEHDKLLEVYCRTDQACVCVLCLMEEHKKHDVVSAAAERTEKQKQLGSKLIMSQERIEEKIKKMQELKLAMESLKSSAQVVLEENERVFTELIQALQRHHAEVLQSIRAQERSTLGRAQAHLDRMEEEVMLLRKRHNDLEMLSHTDDHIHFLLSWQSLSSPSGYEDLTRVTLAPSYSFNPTKKAISDLKTQLEDVSKTELGKISSAVNNVQILQTLEPTTREEFLQYSCPLALDPCTAHPSLRLSQSNTVVRMMTEPTPYSDHPDRFDHWQQVLCTESLAAKRSYWEVDWSGTEVDVAVAYRTISRKGSGNECSFGWNEQSWSLYCSNSKFSFTHSGRSTVIPVPMSMRIGVYLDHRAGTLAFYSVADSMQLLHRVQTTFSEPLYPGFGLWGYGTILRL
ncbi:tripartite motif-containing protein 16 [Denticeps clupeoides]|uniref:tripartite motif-containing protein 16 n=1 Tax=Denticeps clupeoides TaxID=299321 RepID=UPI0010A56213|nr:tripartite motif-containing protein 16-like [Denticeps clupeoides]